jgi:Lantibiotic dehydratase, N terminus
MASIKTAEENENDLPVALPETAWRLAQTFVLRLAGFSIGPLLALGVEHALAEGCQENNSKLQSLLAEELRSKRSRLRAVANDDKFREAVFLSNPTCYERINTYLQTWQDEYPNSSARRIERLIAVYLQRFSAKNESVSFFGPVSFGKFTDGPIAISQEEVLPNNTRSVRIAHWAAEAIASSRHGSPIFLSANNWAPLEYLPPELMTDDIEHLQRLLDAFCLASFQERMVLMKEMESLFTKITGIAPVRNHGQSYGDRMIISEDRHYEIARFSIGGAIVKELTDDYSRIIKFAIQPDSIKFDAMRRSFREFFCSEWGETATIPYLEVADLIAKRPSVQVTIRERAHCLWSKTIEPFFYGLHKILMKGSGQGRVMLTSSDIDALTIATLPGTDPWPCVISPDILIGSKSFKDINTGQYSLVLGELHSGFGTNGFYASVHPDQASFAQELISLYEVAAQGREPVRAIAPIFNKTFADLELPFRAINLGGCPTKRDVTLDLSDLLVSAGAQYLELRETQSNRPLFICTKLPRILGLFPLQLFSFPSCSLDPIRTYLLAQRRHFPRVSYQRFTLLRETWRVAREQLLSLLQGTEMSVLTSFNQYAVQQLWPRCLYVRPEANEKPLFIDRFNPYLLLDLRRRLDRSSAQEIDIVEMLPGPEELWLADDDGSHTSELRMTFISTTGTA